MSKLNAVQAQLRLVEDYPAAPGGHRLRLFAVIALLLAAVAAGLSEIHLLPTFSADEVGSILFGAG